MASLHARHVPRAQLALERAHRRLVAGDRNAAAVLVADARPLIEASQDQTLRARLLRQADSLVQPINGHD